MAVLLCLGYRHLFMENKISEKENDMSVKEQLIALGMTEKDFDRHESDLYVRVTPVSRKFLETYKFKANVEQFIDAIEHVPFYDFPFAAMKERLAEEEASAKWLKDFIQQKRQGKNQDAIQDENLNKACHLRAELEEKKANDSLREGMDFVPHVDWRGFTEQDFRNLQADRKHDPDCQFNQVFYAGDLQLHITDTEWNYTEKQIRLFTLDNGGTPEAYSHEVAGRLTLNMDEIRSMTYEDFRDKVESHLCHLIRDSLYTSQEEKDALIGIMKEPSPKSWAYAHILDLTSVSKELIRNDGKTLQDIEREWVKPNSRKNMLLHGSSKNLMKKLEASLKKDKEIKKILHERQGR